MTYLLVVVAPCVPNRYAIKGSPNQKLLLEDIYYAIESRVSHRIRPGEGITLIHLYSFRTSEQHLQAGRLVSTAYINVRPEGSM